MKTKNFVALGLLLIGTNVFTYATTRYWTTDHVLSSAEDRVAKVIERRRAGEERPGQDYESQIQIAVGMAGGMYHWYNDALLFWGVGGVLVVSGLLTARLTRPTTGTS